MFLMLGWAAILMIFAELLDSSIVLFANLFAVTPFLILFLHVIMKRRFQSVESMPLTSPYIVELKARKILLEHRNSSVHEHIQEVDELFNQATKKFPTFKQLYIWECIYYLEFTRDIHIALLKLSKLHWADIDILRFRGLFRIGVSTEDSRFRSFSLEAEFFKYMLLDSLLKHYKTEEQKLIKYYQWVNTIHSKDLNFCSKMLEFFELLGNPSSRTKREIYRILRGIADSLANTIKQFKKACKAFPQDPVILETFGSFLTDIAQSPIGDEMQNRAHYERSKLKIEESVNHFESYLQKSVAIIIVSGLNKDFGSLVYINELAAEILETTPQAAMGTNIAQFVPEAFNYLHDDNMIRYILFSHGPEVYRHHIVMVSAKKHLIEVTFRFRIHCHKKGVHFIVAIKEKPKNRELIVYQIDGGIIGYTDNLEAILGRNCTNKSIFELFPDLSDMFFNPKPYSPFIYYLEEQQREIGLMFAHCDIGRVRVSMLYAFVRADCLGDLIYKNSLNKLDKQNLSNVKKKLKVIESSSGHLLASKRSEADEPSTKKLQIFMNKYKPEEEIAVNSEQVRTQARQNSYAKNNTSSMLMTSETKKRDKAYNRNIDRKITCFHAIIIMILLLIIASCISSVTLIFQSAIGWDGYDIINKIGFNRAAISSITIDLRSLNLINSGLKLKYEESAYREQIINILNIIKDNEKLLRAFNKDRYRKVTLAENDLKPSLKEMRLEDAMHEFITHASVLVSAPLKDIQIQNSSFYYIYRNGLQELLQAMNRTTFDYQEEEINRLRSLSDEMFLSELSILVPVFALILLGMVPMIFMAEKENQRLWSSLEHCNLGEIKERINLFKNRLETVHAIELPDRSVQIARLKKINISIWPAFTGKLFILIALSISVHVVVWEVGQIQITNYMNYMLNYINWNGLSRGSYLRTYFWMRESYLDLKNYSHYTDNIDQYQHFVHPEVAFNTETASFYYTNNRLSIELNSNVNNVKVDIAEIKDILYGDPCRLITIPIETCTSLYLTKGTAASSMDFVSYLHAMYSMAKQGYSIESEMIQAEGLARDLAKLKIQTFELFTNYFLEKLRYLQQIFISMVILYGIIVILLWFFLYRPSIAALKRDLLEFKRICELVKIRA
jgi:NADPH-dependent 7-cyano-7-deazaguanine reductase QueF-like protein